MARAWFPHPLQITHNGIMYNFETGYRTIPKELDGHWWFQENGVSVIRPTKQNPWL